MGCLATRLPGPSIWASDLTYKEAFVPSVSLSCAVKSPRKAGMGRDRPWNTVPLRVYRRVQPDPVPLCLLQFQDNSLGSPLSQECTHTTLHACPLDLHFCQQTCFLWFILPSIYLKAENDSIFCLLVQCSNAYNSWG